MLLFYLQVIVTAVALSISILSSSLFDFPLKVKHSLVSFNFLLHEEDLRVV